MTEVEELGKAKRQQPMPVQQSKQLKPSAGLRELLGHDLHAAGPQGAVIFTQKIWNV
jgi:hypothetical protein